MRFILGIASLVVLVVGLGLWRPWEQAPPPAEEAEILSVTEAMADRVMGRDDAPVTMQEYSSLTCSHCAAFHRDTLPKIKQAYIDTGKVRLVYNDFPLGGLALAAAMLARCTREEQYFGLIDMFFRSQSKWARSDTPRDELQKLVRLAGMTEDDFNACLDDESLMKSIQQRAAGAGKKHNINSTPTFIIEGTRVPGNLPFEDFKDILDKAIAKKSG